MDSPQTPSNDPEAEAIPASEAIVNTLPRIGSLGNLAQSERLKQIKTARGVLIFIGVISVLYGLFMFVFASNMVDAEIDNEIRKLGPNFVIDHQKLEPLKQEAVGKYRLGAGLVLLEGTVFFLLGVFVQKAPVPLTATGLIMYVADYAVGAVFDPTYLYKGIVVKIIILVCLFRALNAAIAYERNRKQLETGRRDV